MGQWGAGPVSQGLVRSDWCPQGFCPLDTSFPPGWDKSAMAGQVLGGGGITLCTGHAPLWIPCTDWPEPDEAI